MKKLWIILILFCTSIVETRAQPKQIPVVPLPSLSMDTLSLSGLDKVFSNTITTDIKVVGVGATSFTLSEGIRFSNKLIQYLVLEKGFKTIVLLRDDWKLRDLNAYLTNSHVISDNDILAITKQTFNQSIYCTEETLELLKWLKDYDHTHPDSPVQFKGINFTEPMTPGYLLAKYIIPTDSLSGRAIAKKRSESQDDASAYADITSWFSQRRETLKKQLAQREYADLQMDMDNLIYLRNWPALSNAASKNYFDSCLSMMITKLAAEHKKLVVCADNSIIARALIKTDVVNKNLGILLNEQFGKSYYVAITDYYHNADFFWIDPKSGQSEQTLSTADRNSTAYLLHQRYKVGSGIVQYDDLVQFNVPVSFNVHSLYNKLTKCEIQPGIAPFNILAVFNDEYPIKILKR
jgi:hypothetical protein